MSHIFAMLHLGIWVLGRKTAEVKCHSHHILPFSSHPSKHTDDLSTWLITVDVDLQHLAEFVFVRLLHCNLPLYLSQFYCTFYREITIFSPYLGNGDLCSTSKRMGIHYLEPLLSHLFNYLFISIWTHEYSFCALYYNPKLIYFTAQLFAALDMGSSFSKIQISDLCHFSLPWRTSFMLLCRVFLQTMNSLSLHVRNLYFTTFKE